MLASSLAGTRPDEPSNPPGTPPACPNLHTQTLTFRAGRTISLTHPTTPPFSSGPDRDHAVYRIHPDAIFDLLAPHGTPPTLTIGDHHAELTETHLAPLRAFAATLKPGYTPP